MNILTRQLNKEAVNEALDQLHKDLPGFSASYFQDTPSTKRQTFSFGYDYFSMSEGNKTFIPIPEYLKKLCAASIEALEDKKITGNADDYLNVIVSIYRPGYRLEPHIDVDEEDEFTDGKPVDFYFGKTLLGVILDADETGHLYFVKSDSGAPKASAPKSFEVDEKPGTVFLISGAFRSKPYYHGVSAVKNSRISVTFRTVKFK